MPSGAIGEIRVGYGEELERFDVKLGELLEHLREGDLLMITADHGMIRLTREQTIREKSSVYCLFPIYEREGNV